MAQLIDLSGSPLTETKPSTTPAASSPLSRRKFLSNGMAVGAGVALATPALIMPNSASAGGIPSDAHVIEHSHNSGLHNEGRSRTLVRYQKPGDSPLQVRGSMFTGRWSVHDLRAASAPDPVLTSYFNLQNEYGGTSGGDGNRRLRMDRNHANRVRSRMNDTPKLVAPGATWSGSRYKAADLHVKSYRIGSDKYSTMAFYDGASRRWKSYTFDYKVDRQGPDAEQLLAAIRYQRTAIPRTLATVGGTAITGLFIAATLKSAGLVLAISAVGAGIVLLAICAFGATIAAIGLAENLGKIDEIKSSYAPFATTI
ncbi:hypothetical protein L0664_14695 [Octadecabacter sp. G9-8]|uniref:Twin-arginine translocation signal domain-containing protein n=1 Tax=Octadecabacter dasysiphoniae TaxID=2909341 RepID=A0ABS9CYH3_9RHOB|nr:hypothetical protein [Octadecabacter dasysiphoniae]MCF2872320.1 hypothetical protein [Octadecabacter dasysiphoniae]